MGGLSTSEVCLEYLILYYLTRLTKSTDHPILGGCQNHVPFLGVHIQGYIDTDVNS